MTERPPPDDTDDGDEDESEFDRFEELTRKLLDVPKEDIDEADDPSTSSAAESP